MGHRINDNRLHPPGVEVRRMKIPWTIFEQFEMLGRLWSAEAKAKRLEMEKERLEKELEWTKRQTAR